MNAADGGGRCRALSFLFVDVVVVWEEAQGKRVLFHVVFCVFRARDRGFRN